MRPEAARGLERIWTMAAGMAERKGQRSRQGQARGVARARSAARKVPLTNEELQRECDRLRAELEAARAEIAAMRTRQEDVLNRIDWVIDSLNSLPEIDS